MKRNTSGLTEAKRSLAALAVVAALLLAGLALSLDSGRPAQAAGPKVLLEEIQPQLRCVKCDCTMVLSTCDCEGAQAERKEIEQLIDQGYSKDRIFAELVKRYGEYVLMAPPKRGFNLTAWITPFAAIFSGGGVIYVVLRRWVGSRGAAAEDQAARGRGPADAMDEEERQRYLSRLQDELRKHL